MPRLIAIALLFLCSSSFAETPNNIAALCKKEWPGKKGMQTFCIKEKRNYQDWLKYTRKRVFANTSERNRIDGCIKDHKPDYRQAYDCYFDPGLFRINLF